MIVNIFALVRLEFIAVALCCEGLPVQIRSSFVDRVSHYVVWTCAQFGYSVYRQVIGYYSREEDAYGEFHTA